MPTIKRYPAEYIGDGVYVYFDDFAFWLLANDSDKPTDTICLEPSVLMNLNQFVKQQEVKKL
jgi:hypothetical protein